MALFNNAIFLGRLAVLPFGPLLWIVVWLSLRYRARFSKNSTVRMVQALVIGLVLVAIIMIQLRLYGSIAQDQHPARDNVVFSVLLAQSLVGIFLTFGMLLSRRPERSS